MNSFMKQKQTHGHKIQSTVTKGEGGGINQELGIKIHTLLYGFPGSTSGKEPACQRRRC